ncbi:MAG TPA: xanthine dehydrogenase family protein molybdopterin-binding subunit [Candidatus Nitrosotalea sp.]|nr:xanthine dehydrogenase family protein molybdopterin-binding subunit [Candidatus Nitrosotalea sp.]
MSGERQTRIEDARLLRGRGRYVDDLHPDRVVHLALVRSPHPRARIIALDAEAARSAPGVVGLLTGAETSGLVEPWRGVLSHYQGMKSAAQYPLALGQVRFSGEPVAAVVAASRALAEDACELVSVEYEPLTALASWEQALAPGAPLVDDELEDNIMYRAHHGDAGATAAALAASDHVVRGEFHFGRVTGVPIEPRALVADFDPGSGQLTVHCSSQVPHMMQAVLARILGLDQSRIRVIADDVGGSFGVKIHVYQDEICACLFALRLGRPVKFVADRRESMLTDIHAREEVIEAELGVNSDGTVQGLSARVIAPVGAYSMYPRSSVVESGQVARMLPGQYRIPAYSCEQLVVAQNKTPTSQYRAVGHPLATAVIEQLMDRAARRLGMDPVQIRLANVIRPQDMPYTSAAGPILDPGDYPACLTRLLEVAAYAELRARQAESRGAGRLVGIGLCSFLELTGPNAQFYGVGGAPISAKDGATVRLEPDGTAVALVGITDQGQGTRTSTAQLVAAGLGIPVRQVRVLSGDTLAVPYGGGTWASRSAVVGGTAIVRATRLLRRKILEHGADLLEAAVEDLELDQGRLQVRGAPARSLALAELAATVHYNSNRLDPAREPSLEATSYFVSPNAGTFAYGSHLAMVEVDRESWSVRLLRYVAVDDCGVAINPALIEGQVRGGVVQGIGEALLEELVYDPEGQLLNASLMEYLLPTMGDLCDIEVHHLSTPASVGEGFRGVGESGAAAAPGAIANAVADALAPLGVEPSDLPLTPYSLFQLVGAEHA